MNFIDLLKGTAGLLSGIGTLLLGIAALLPHIKRLLKKKETKKNLRDMGLLLGILLLIISASIFVFRINPLPIEVKITSPKDGDKVQGYSIVTGTIIGELPEGQYMRIISNIQSIPGAWWPQGGAIKPQNGFWNAEVWLGFDKIDAGKNFTIAVILVSENDNKIFVKYGEEAQITGKYDPIPFPNNATIMDKVTVTRI